MSLTDVWQKLFSNFQWQNRPSTATPLGKANLQKLNDAIDGIDDRVLDLKDGVDDITTALDDKVDKVAGKGLSTEDFTTTEKTKLAGISAEANKVEITPVVTEGTTLATISIDGVDTDIKGSDIDVDDEMSPTSPNPVENKVIYSALNDLLPEETAEGNPISITDASGLSAKSCEVTMNPIQDLHGQSAPYPAGGMKNKLPFDLATIKTNNTDGTWNENNYTYNGVTWTVNDDGTYTANGTATGGISVLLIIGKPSQVSSTVNLSFPTTDYKITTGFTIEGTNSTYEIGYRPASSSSATKHIYNNDGYALLSTDINLIQLVVREGYTANNLKFEPMIVPSTESDYTFVPYSNICPISGRDSLVLGVSGKNLFDKSTIISGYKLKNNGSIVESSTFFVSDYIPIVPLDYIAENIVGTGQGVGLWTYDENKTAIRSLTPLGQTPRNKIFTAQDNEKYIRICGKLDSLNNVQVEFGSTATTYEAFRGLTTHTATFPETVYNGTWKATEGKAIITHKYVDLGDYEWTLRTELSPIKIYRMVGLTDRKIGTNFICDSYKCGGISRDYLIANDLTIAPWNSSGTGICLRDDNLTEQTITTALSGVHLCYELATPTEITLTPETIELLKGNNTLSSDGDNITLKYSADIKEWVLAQLQS